MNNQVVVLGSGYAGAGAIKSLESTLGGDADLRWISDVDYHLVLHESHRCIRDPSVREKITIPVEDIKSPATAFRQATVVNIDTDDRTVHLEDGEVEYDYLVVGLGSETAFFGIDGLEEHARTHKGLEDALSTHDDLISQAEVATRDDPLEVVVGGAGLTGIQIAGEIAELRDEESAPIEIHLVEGLDEIYPNGSPEAREAIRERLEARDVDIWTGEFISEVDETTVHIGETEEIAYDMLIWAGGVTGRAAIRDIGIQTDERSGRLSTGQDFQTEDERVFALGDTAFIDQPGDEVAPPTAQAAWQAADVVGKNVARAIRDEPLEKWVYNSKGTVVSVGDEAIAHDIYGLPVIDAFDGRPAEFLKKGIATRWISDVDGLGRALSAWPDM